MKITNAIADLFGQSPIRPLQAHMELSSQAANKLLALVDASQRDDWPLCKTLDTEISALADESEAIKKNLRLHLPKSLFLPVARTDLLDLLSCLGKIPASIKASSRLILGRQLTFPQALHSDFHDFVATCSANVEQAGKVVGELDELLETGFSGPELKIVETLVEELGLLEKRAEDQQQALSTCLLQFESQLSPIAVMFMYRSIDALITIAIRAQAVGERLLVLIAR